MGEGGGGESSWHTADGSSITVSPPSGGRSEERPPPLSPSLLLAPRGCYVTELEEGVRRGEEGGGGGGLSSIHDEGPHSVFSMLLHSRIKSLQPDVTAAYSTLF